MHRTDALRRRARRLADQLGSPQHPRVQGKGPLQAWLDSSPGRWSWAGLRQASVIPLAAVATLSLTGTIAAGLPSAEDAARDAFSPVGTPPAALARRAGEPETVEVVLRISQEAREIQPARAPSPLAAPAASPVPAPPEPRTAPTTAAPVTTAAPRQRSRAPETSAPRRVTTSSTTAAPRATTAPRPTSPPTTVAPATTSAPAPAPAQWQGRAGHSGTVGCQVGCRQLGFQDLDGARDLVLENVVISNPTGRCITLRNAHNVTLRNVTITNCGTQSAVTEGYDTGLVLISNSSNITIENSRIHNISAGRHGGSRNNAVQAENSTGVRIVNNEFRDIHSDRHNHAGDRGNRSIVVLGNNSHGLTVERNTFQNAGRNALQLKQARNLQGVSFSHNVVAGRGPWNSDYEDMINLYSASGRPGDPIRIQGNYLRDGGPSAFGTGIIAGDGNPGDGPTQYVLVERNVMLNPGHVGINLAGGDNITVRDNIIHGDVDVPLRTTVGLIINHFGYSTDCRDHVVTGNRVHMRNQHLGGGVNHLWDPSTCTQNVRVDNNRFGDPSLDRSIWNP